MIPLALIGAALATSVYINGVRADVLPEVTLANATVRIDAQGNVWIDAPGYRVSVVQPQPYAGTSSAPAGYGTPPASGGYGTAPTTGGYGTSAPAPASGGYGTAATGGYGTTAPPYGPPPTTNGGSYGTTAPSSATTPAYGASTPTYGATSPTAATPAPAYTPPAPTNGVPVGQWWLVTEDNASTGHTIDVIVNGTLVRRIASGEPQLILDLGPFLHPGANNVTLTASPGPQPGGGVFNVYIGKGSNQSGTIRIDNPEIRFSRRSTDNASGTSRQFTLNVN